MSHHEIDEIAPGVWRGAPGPSEGVMGAVVGDELTLIIDSTSYPPFAARFVEALGSDRPHVLYITHRHFDHFGGAAAIEAPVMSHRLTRAALAGYDDKWVERNVASWVERGMMDPELVGEPRVVIPQIVFEDRAGVNVGGLEVQLWHVGGHCADQTVAYLRAHRLLWASDNVFSDRDDPPIAHADVPTWIAALERLRELPIDIVVPGHGPVGGAELIDAQLEQLRAVNIRQMQALV